ncbi:MAG: glycine/betaine ABC transporter substrate-binding protein [Desulfatiglans sp.]|nr:glycine/betaine ABC transporter substrate-binding protein [Desulfatiglans sp.]
MFLFIPVLLFSIFSISITAYAEKKIVIGGKNFTEQHILSELAGILLEKNGFDVKMRTGVGSTVARQSLEKGQIDLYYEYTGTAYTIYHKQKDRDIMTDHDKCYDWVKNTDSVKGLIWLDPVQFNNTYTLLMRNKQAENLGIKSISDLGDYINRNKKKLVVGVGAEFWERPDGFKPLMKMYGFSIPYNKLIKMDDGLVYKALKERQIDVSMGFATDGRISSFGFVVLRDDKGYFPVYNPAPVIRKDVLDEYPEIKDILKPVAEKLTTKEMQRLNAMVDIEHKEISEVGLKWLKDQGIIF